MSVCSKPVVFLHLESHILGLMLRTELLSNLIFSQHPPTHDAPDSIDCLHIGPNQILVPEAACKNCFCAPKRGWLCDSCVSSDRSACLKVRLTPGEQTTWRYRAAAPPIVGGRMGAINRFETLIGSGRHFGPSIGARLFLHERARFPSRGGCGGPHAAYMRESCALLTRHK